MMKVSRLTHSTKADISVIDRSNPSIPIILSFEFRVDLSRIGDTIQYYTQEFKIHQNPHLELVVTLY